jgi:hypothetical protein
MRNSCRHRLGDVLAIIGLSAVAATTIIAVEVLTLRAAAAQVGPELVVRACAADRPGVCETRVFPRCDVDAAAEALAAEGLVVRLASCVPAQREA